MFIYMFLYIIWPDPIYSNGVFLKSAVIHILLTWFTHTNVEVKAESLQFEVLSIIYS